MSVIRISVSNLQYRIIPRDFPTPSIHRQSRLRCVSTAVRLRHLHQLLRFTTEATAKRHLAIPPDGLLNTHKSLDPSRGKKCPQTKVRKRHIEFALNIPQARLISDKVKAARKLTIRNIQSAISRRFGEKYKLDVFGSTRYGVSSAKSDLDLVIIDPNNSQGYGPGCPTKLPKIYNVRSIASCLRKAGFKQVDSLPKARVPIVKLVDPVTGLACDINVNNRLGLVNSELIRHYCEIFPLLRPILLSIKDWARPLGLNNPSARGVSVTFSSYALALMTIGFLQTEGLLPNLQANLPPIQPSDTAHIWWETPQICCDLRYARSDHLDLYRGHPKPILHKWFQFWGSQFKYDQDIMSIRHGGIIPRVPLEEFHAAPSPSSSFGNTSMYEVDDPRPISWGANAVCVIDPFIRSKNVTQSIGRNVLTTFASECQQTANMDIWDDVTGNVGAAVEQARNELSN